MIKLRLPWMKEKSDTNAGEPARHYLIFGLGNPGPQYRDNRHNVGFKAIDALSKRLDIPLKRVQFKAMWGSGVHEGVKITLVKPQTFMNLSGQAVASFVHFYKVPLENILVICDDMDIPFGTIRVRKAGSSGGQNGLNSIIEKLGSREFPRLRIGIGRPPGRMQGMDYVLQDFHPQEMAELETVLDKAASAALAVVQYGINRAMTEFNGTPTHAE